MYWAYGASYHSFIDQCFQYHAGRLDFPWSFVLEPILGWVDPGVWISLMFYNSTPLLIQTIDLVMAMWAAVKHANHYASASPNNMM